MAMHTQWDITSTKVLLTFFEENEFLHNDSHPDYKNKIMRAEKLTELKDLLHELGYQTLDEGAIKRKWNALKTNFNAEMNKVLAKKSGTWEENDYTPTVWWWPFMQFLTGRVVANQSTDYIEVDEPHIIQGPVKKKHKQELNATEDALKYCAGMMTSIMQQNCDRKEPDEIDKFTDFINAELRLCKQRNKLEYKTTKKSILQIIVNMQNYESD